MPLTRGRRWPPECLTLRQFPFENRLFSLLRPIRTGVGWAPGRALPGYRPGAAPPPAAFDLWASHWPVAQPAASVSSPRKRPCTARLPLGWRRGGPRPDRPGEGLSLAGAAQGGRVSKPPLPPARQSVPPNSMRSLAPVFPYDFSNLRWFQTGRFAIRQINRPAAPWPDGPKPQIREPPGPRHRRAKPPGRPPKTPQETACEMPCGRPERFRNRGFARFILGRVKTGAPGGFSDIQKFIEINAFEINLDRK